MSSGDLVAGWGGTEIRFCMDSSGRFCGIEAAIVGGLISFVSSNSPRISTKILGFCSFTTLGFGFGYVCFALAAADSPFYFLVYCGALYFLIFSFPFVSCFTGGLHTSIGFSFSTYFRL